MHTCTYTHTHILKCNYFSCFSFLQMCTHAHTHTRTHILKCNKFNYFCFSQTRILQHNPYVWSLYLEKTNLPVLQVVIKERGKREMLKLSQLSIAVDVFISVNCGYKINISISYKVYIEMAADFSYHYLSGHLPCV